jgi:hypothetical protein
MQGLISISLQEQQAVIRLQPCLDIGQLPYIRSGCSRPANVWFDEGFAGAEELWTFGTSFQSSVANSRRKEMTSPSSSRKAYLSGF